MDIFKNGKPVSFLLLGEKHHEMKEIKCKDMRGPYNKQTVAQFLEELTDPERYDGFEFPTTFDFYVEGPLNKRGEYEKGCSLDNIMRCFTDLPSNVRKHRVDIRKIVIEESWFTVGKDNDVDRNWQVVDNSGTVSEEETEKKHKEIYEIIESFFLGFLPSEIYRNEPEKEEEIIKNFETSQEELRALFNTPTSNESQNKAQSTFIKNVLSKQTLPKIRTKFTEAYNISRFKNNTNSNTDPLILVDCLLSHLEYWRDTDRRINALARMYDFVSLAREYIFQGWGFLMDLYTLICIFKKRRSYKTESVKGRL